MDHNAQPQGQPSHMDIDIHEPFTTAERIQQLSKIDNVRSLLTLSSSSPQQLTNPSQTTTGHRLPPRTNLQCPPLPRLPTTLHLHLTTRPTTTSTNSPRRPRRPRRRRHSPLHPNPIHLPLHPRPRRQATPTTNLRHGRSRHHQPAQQ